MKMGSKSDAIRFEAQCTCPTMKAIPKVDIDPEGEFQYILMKVKCPHKDHDHASITIVRGYKRHNNHTDMFNEVKEVLQPLCDEVIGAGKIKHDPTNHTIHIFGKSESYPNADHEITAKLIKDAYPGYTVTVGNEE